MLQDYFIINGTKYYSGTVFVINFNGKHKEAVFICYLSQTNAYKCKIDATTWIIAEKDFYNNIVEISNNTDPKIRAPAVKVKKDTEIDGLFWGWMWYIFLMAVSSIFNNAVVLWILISVVFFSFRKRKIKEEGTYIEW